MFRNTWHFFHFAMTILTGGLWVFVWVWRAWANRSHNERVFASLGRGGQQSTVVNVTTPTNLSDRQIAEAVARSNSGSLGFARVDLTLTLCLFAVLAVAFASMFYSMGGYNCRASYLGMHTRYSLIYGCEVRTNRGWLAANEVGR